MTVKERLRGLAMRVPGGPDLLDRYRQVRWRLADRRDLRVVFTSAYQRNRWGDPESISGPGSTVRYTENIRKELPALIDRLGATQVLDAPCGDYNWFRLVPRSSDVEYTGGEIVDALVAKLQVAYGNGNTRFVRLDITSDPLPPADLWICRDVLIHFSNRRAFQTLANLLRSRIKYFLTTSHPECTHNTDIVSGRFRMLNLQLPPFSFCEPLLMLDDWIEGSPRSRLCLWETRTLAEVLEPNKAVQRAVRQLRG